MEIIRVAEADLERERVRWQRIQRIPRYGLWGVGLFFWGLAAIRALSAVVVARQAAIGLDKFFAVLMDPVPRDRAFVAAWEVVLRTHLSAFGAMALTGTFITGLAFAHRELRRSLHVLWHRIAELEQELPRG